MSPRARVTVYVLLGLSAITAMGVLSLQFRALRPAPLASFKRVPDFQLVERSGQPVGLSDLQGKVWLADFVYSTCPGPCPMISSRLRELQTRTLKNPDVRLVSISTDPEHDTPAVLQDYAKNFQASEHWLFLTGEKAKVYDLIQNGFMLAVVPQNDAKNPVVHSTKLVLVDRQGVIRKFYDGQNAGNDAEILRDIEQLVRKGTK